MILLSAISMDKIGMSSVGAHDNRPLRSGFQPKGKSVRPRTWNPVLSGFFASKCFVRQGALASCQFPGEPKIGKIVEIHALTDRPSTWSLSGDTVYASGLFQKGIGAVLCLEKALG